MSSIKEVRVPDLGDFRNVDVIEVLVKPGDPIRLEEPLATLESDKASMDLPSPLAGVVREVKIKVGDKVSAGDLVLLLEADGEAHGSDPALMPTVPATLPPVKVAAPSAPLPATAVASPAMASPTTALRPVYIPDIGNFENVEVIEVLTEVGDTVRVEDPLLMLESDKASMEVPSPLAGVVRDIKMRRGDRVSKGDLILLLEVVEEGYAIPTLATPPPAITLGPTAQKPAYEPPKPPVTPSTKPTEEVSFTKVHASPSVRLFARELGVDLTRIGDGSGLKGRILKEDVQAFVKKTLAQAAAPSMDRTGIGTAGGTGIPPIPPVDFSQFGEIEMQPLSKIKRLTGIHLSRSWLNLPHVTHHDEADITDTEAFRNQLTEDVKAQGIRITLLSFLLKACAVLLKRHPTFNSSLDPSGEQLILKHYVHIGIAVDTPDGLVVPVLRDVDRKGLLDLSREVSEASRKAREKKLRPTDMQGGCFTISSLGGIGGTGFTPIVNAPEVAILGVTRARMAPVWDGQAFVPRLRLPLSLSYDHRVIDGAQAARFVSELTELLSDIRRLLL